MNVRAAIALDSLLCCSSLPFPAPACRPQETASSAATIIYIYIVLFILLILVNELLGQFGHSDGGSGFDVGQGVADH